MAHTLQERYSSMIDEKLRRKNVQVFIEVNAQDLRQEKIKMAIRQILKINNPEELLILRKKSKPVEVFDERLNTLITDMIDTMKRADGAG